MSFPNTPPEGINPIEGLDSGQVALLLLVSIAFEELGLAHLINAEAEKLQAAIGSPLTPGGTANPDLIANDLNQLLEANRAAERMLRTIIKKEMLLQFKFENVLDLIAATTTTASLTITKTDSPDPVIEGQNLTYTINVTNTGTTPLTNFTVTDPLPPETTFVSASAPVGFTMVTPPVGSPGTVIFSIPVFNPGSTATFQIVVRSLLGFPPGTVITNTATADANEIAPISATTTTTLNPGLG